MSKMSSFQPICTVKRVACFKEWCFMTCLGFSRVELLGLAHDGHVKDAVPEILADEH